MSAGVGNMSPTHTPAGLPPLGWSVKAARRRSIESIGMLMFAACVRGTSDVTQARRLRCIGRSSVLLSPPSDSPELDRFHVQLIPTEQEQPRAFGVQRSRVGGEQNDRQTDAGCVEDAPLGGIRVA